MLEPLQSMMLQLQRVYESLGLELSISLGILTVCLIMPWIRIFKRVGFSPGAALLMFIPLVNIFVFLVFAYHEWPIERDLRTPDSASLWR
jgi:hypothetical protein